MQCETTSYETNPLTCRTCGSSMEIISVILDPGVIDKILNHLKSKAIEPGRDPPADSVCPGAIPP